MNIEAEVAAMEEMSAGELAERYAELTGQSVWTRHRAYLVRKIAWRLQADAEGDLSERARRRAAELADNADVRLMPPNAGTIVCLGLEEVDAEVMSKNLGMTERDQRKAAKELILNQASGRALVRSQHFLPYWHLQIKSFEDRTGSA